MLPPSSRLEAAQIKLSVLYTCPSAYTEPTPQQYETESILTKIIPART